MIKIKSKIQFKFNNHKVKTRNENDPQRLYINTSNINSRTLKTVRTTTYSQKFILQQLWILEIK